MTEWFRLSRTIRLFCRRRRFRNFKFKQSLLRHADRLTYQSDSTIFCFASTQATNRSHFLDSSQHSPCHTKLFNVRNFESHKGHQMGKNCDLLVAWGHFHCEVLISFTHTQYSLAFVETESRIKKIENKMTDNSCTHLHTFRTVVMTVDAALVDNIPILGKTIKIVWHNA